MLKERYAAGGVTQTALAAEFGISQPAVSAILRGKWHSAPVMVMTKEEELARRRQQRFQSVYGISYEDWQAKLEAAGFACEGCGHPAPVLSCDHDHRTGAVRGPLCPNCNSVLGFVDDSIERLEGLVAYLKKYQGVL